MGGNNAGIRIRKISDAGELDVVRNLAGKIFPATYTGLIPEAQIPYMMRLMYDDSVLRKEFACGMNFALILDGETPIGYICWHPAVAGGRKIMRLEKLYLDFAYHGRGIGNMGLRYVTDEAKRAGAAFVSLNVNKNNLRAQKAYLRAGFYRWRCDVEDVGGGFVKNDYIMRFDLTPMQLVDPAGFVRVTDLVPDALLDIRYAAADNFTGVRIDGYEAPTALLTVAAAEALQAVGDEARAAGWRLRIFDAYRPVRAVAHFMRWAQDPADVRRKALFYPDVDKTDLIPCGYISGRSGHSRGSTVDLTLCDMVTGKDADVGGTFDWFGRESHPDWCGDPETGEYTGRPPGEARRIDEAQFRNRMRLRAMMMRHGFQPVASEWWHFTLIDEPYPDTYFDFPVK